jgi:NAD+ synthase (glutamine-hydrolysing)
MKTLKVSAACLNQIPMDWDGNFSRIKGVVAEAQSENVDVLCLPELAITGYGCEDMFLAPDICVRAREMLVEILDLAPEMVVAVGLPWRHHNTVFNVAAVVCGGEVVGLYAKQNLAGDGVHYEPRWFSAWPSGEVAVTEFCGEDVLIGDLLFEIGGVKIGVEICEDAWVADRPGSQISAYGVDVILNPSASHFAFGKQHVRERFVLEGSRAFGVAYVYANLLGNESGRMIFDGGAMIASCGELVASEKRFSFMDWTLTTAVIDVELNQTKQAVSASRKVHVEDYVGLVRVGLEWKENHNLPSDTIERKLWCKEEEFSRTVALALFDYMRKSHSRGFVLSLSGGADSSAVACLVKLSLDFALAELGEDGVRKKLSYLELPKDSKSWMKELLACVYQASDNSGGETEESAESLAESVGAEYQRWNISELVTGYTGMVSDGIGRKLTWKEDDITLQNIQARVRAPGIWMLANIRNGLLLSTSNRSEAAVGYATMDGDTCGGVSPIAGIDKAFLRHWLSWLETSDMEGIEPISALNKVNALNPTAELRPEEYDQTDESDLMPYSVLDAIEKAAIRDKRSPKDVLALMGKQFHDSGYDDKVMKAWVIKFFKLWSRNQWKRERYAPSFHLDDENLDPKTWCRFPILSGSFTKELSEL